MKPSIDMEGGKHTGNVAVVVQPEKVNPGNTQKPQRNRIIVGAVIGLITVVVITTTVVLAVYFGIRMTRDTYKDAWTTYQTADGQPIVQKTEVKDDEIDITVANDMKVIYDYKNEIEVIRMKNPETGRYGDCYAKPLNESETDYVQGDGAMEGPALIISHSRIQNGAAGNDEYSVQYRKTSVRVPKYRLSSSVSEMCQGGNIYWLERMESQDRIKRAMIDVVVICVRYRDGDWIITACAIIVMQSEVVSRMN